MIEQLEHKFNDRHVKALSRAAYGAGHTSETAGRLAVLITQIKPEFAERVTVELSGSKVVRKKVSSDLPDLSCLAYGAHVAGHNAKTLPKLVAIVRRLTPEKMRSVELCIKFALPFADHRGSSRIERHRYGWN